MTEPEIHDLLSEVATHPPARWQSLLAKRLPHDPGMVQQALLWLHASGHHDQMSDAPPSLGELGDARYELSVRLDSGATASVWQAQDRKLGRTVAMKVFHRRGDSELLHQVMAEARAACDVISDHVVRVLDVHEGAHPYIVMELIGEHDPDRGELTLGTAASSSRPADLEEAVRWVMEVARGVHDAHLRNIFHRDLKPHNVLVTPITRRARVADFGLAVGAAGHARGASTLSIVRCGPSGPVTVSGTPDFIAPEQARGLPLDLDPRSASDRAVLVGIDVWGLGALAYDLLAGRPPWQPRSRDEESWELAASGERPPRLVRTPRGERIPARLRRVVEKALAAEPGARYATAGQVANELAAFLAHRPTSHDRSRLSRVALWCRRNPRLTMTGLVAIGLVALTLATRATVTRLRRERDALGVEVATHEAELLRVKTNIKKTRSDLADAEKLLAAVRVELAALEASLEEERKTYQVLLEGKDQALARANTTTRQLVERLDLLRSELRGNAKTQIELDRKAATAYREAERLLRERDRARRERDTVRTERDGLREERDAVVAEQEKLLRELERVRSELAKIAGRSNG